MLITPLLQPLPYIGLNAEQYAVATTGVNKERQLGVLDSQVPDSERFRDTDPLPINCAKCSTVSLFSRLTEDEVRLLVLSSSMTLYSIHSSISWR